MTNEKKNTPHLPPIGFVLHRTARAVTAAFERHLFDGDSSLSVWMVLLAIHQSPMAQNQITEFVDLRGPTLTHHLNAMEKKGLIQRKRSPTDGRVHVVSITPSGHKKFLELRTKANRFDVHLRKALTPQELDQLRSLLGQIDSGL